MKGLSAQSALFMIPRTNFHLKPDNPVSQLFWGRCPIEKAAAFSFYKRDSRIRKLIHQLKYKGVREIGPELGRIYARFAEIFRVSARIDIIIPVPLHPVKRRRRGFNQSELIAQGISEVSGIPVDRNTHKRITVTKTQTRKSRYDRWTNVEDIFSYRS